MWWNNDIIVAFSFFLAFFVVVLAVPSIVNVANVKGLYDKPGQRKSHSRNIPTLGGIATFAGILLSLSIFTDMSVNREISYLLASMTILFFIGLKDDILTIAPSKKLSGELLSILIIVFFGDIRFTSLHGFLGIHQIPYIASIFLTIFAMIVIINAFNLIDGIDGLASGLGILIAITFGAWFYVTGNTNYTILCAGVAGAYISFFGFNVFGDRNKLFMGDTGSLMLGLLVAVMVIRFNEDNIGYSGPYAIQSAPAVSFGILIVPLFDTLRVFVLRIRNGQSPFHADKNHIHHRLLLLGFSHFESTLIITSINILFIALMGIFKWVGLIPLMALNFSLALGFVWFMEFIIRRNSKEQLTISTLNHFENRSAKSA